MTTKVILGKPPYGMSINGQLVTRDNLPDFTGKNRQLNFYIDPDNYRILWLRTNGFHSIMIPGTGLALFHDGRKGASIRLHDNTGTEIGYGVLDIIGQPMIVDSHNIQSFTYCGKGKEF